jgi:hypothetical protein
MIAACEFVLHSVGEGLAGSAVGTAAAVVYLPVACSMRAVRCRQERAPVVAAEIQAAW